MNGPLFLLLLAAAVSAQNTKGNTQVGQGQSGNAGAAGAVTTQPGGTSGTSLNTVGPATLQGSMPDLAPAPTLNIGPEAGRLLTSPAATPAGADLRAPGRVVGSNVAPAGRVASPSNTPSRAAALAAPQAGAGVVGAALDAAPGTPGAADSRSPGGPAAASSLGGAARGVSGARAVPSSDGLAERAALDKTFDAAVQGRALSGFNGATPNQVAGQLQTLRGRVDQTLDQARQAPPADAPAHYAGLLDFLKDKLVPSAYGAMEKAVKRVAYAKADAALPELAQASYAAAARGEAGETKRLLKGFDAWESLLGSPAQPLISNGAMLAADVSRRLEAARAGRGEPAPARTLWFERRGDRYVAALPGSALERLSPGLALGFALKPGAVPVLGEGLDAAWRAFSADPTVTRGSREVYRGRRARGSSVPAALSAAGGFWLRSTLHKLWLAVRSLFVPSSYALGTPSGLARLRADLSLQAEVASAGAAVRAALTGDAPTVGRAREALDALEKQAAAHEKLRGRVARSGASALAAAFRAATAGLPESEPLDDRLAALVFGADGVLRQSQAMTQDAAAAVDRGVFAGGGASFTHSEGTRQWTAMARRGGGVTLTADLRATGAGGYVDLRAPGDDAVAARLAELGFVTRLDRGVVTATLDADALDLPAEGMSPLARSALAAASGAR